MVTRLEQFLIDKYGSLKEFDKLPRCKQSEVLNAYWKKNMPEVLTESK